MANVWCIDRHAIDWGLEDMWGEWSPADALTPECMRSGATPSESSGESNSTTAARTAKAPEFSTSSKIPGADALKLRFAPRR